MKTCQVQSREDRSGGKQVPCGRPAELKVRYKDFGPYPAHITYMCAHHALMAQELQKVERKDD